MDTPAPSGTPSSSPGVARALGIYTGLRFALFLGAFGLLLVLGTNGALALLVALVVSSVLSLLLLRSQRSDVSASLMARNDRRRAERERLRALLDEPADPAGPGA